MDFIIVGLPRSGTTWAANWLTTDRTHCFHDPLYNTHYEDWDSKVIPGKLTGVSCTGIWRWKEWLNKHPAKKVILHRDLEEINLSLRQIGLPTVDEDSVDMLKGVHGMHVHFSDLFEAGSASNIWSYLTESPMNLDRHEELRLIEMQPQFMGLSVGEDVTRRLRAELSSI